MALPSIPILTLASQLYFPMSSTRPWAEGSPGPPAPSDPCPSRQWGWLCPPPPTSVSAWESPLSLLLLGEKQNRQTRAASGPAWTLLCGKQAICELWLHSKGLPSAKMLGSLSLCLGLDLRLRNSEVLNALSWFHLTPHRVDVTFNCILKISKARLRQLLGIEPRVFHMLGKHSPLELDPQPFCFVFWDRVSLLSLPWLALNLWLFCLHFQIVGINSGNLRNNKLFIFF
jgi:hypothetical protein